MNTKEKKITQFQLFFLIFLTQIGIGVISLPYEVFKDSESDAWISVIIAGFFVQINIVLIWLLYRRFPSLTIFEMMSEVVGKHIAFIFKIAYILFFSSVAILLILLFGRMTHIWIIPRTPNWIILLIMISLCVFCVKENLTVMARYYFVVSFSVIFFLILITSFVKGINILNILPVGQTGFPSIIKGTAQSLLSFLGYEMLLVIFPYSLGKSVGKLKVALLANGIVTIIYAYITFVCLTYLGPYVMKLIPEPILFILKFRSFQIIERTDLLFLSVWIATFGTSIMMYLYLTSNGLANMFTKTNRSTLLFCTATLLYILVLFIPTNDNVINLISNYIKFASYFFIFGLPCILLFVSILRGKKGSPETV